MKQPRKNLLLALTSYMYVALTLMISETTAHNLQSRGSFKVHSPGYVSVVKSPGNSQGGIVGRQTEEFSLFISSFSANPFASDYIYRIPDIGGRLGQLSSVRPETVTNGVVWPNEISTVPDSVFGRRFISLAGGFLVPLKTKGSINLFDVSKGSVQGPYDITDDSQDHGWFYHRVLWVDMNGDGKKDALTCRAKKPIFGATQGELLWFQFPKGTVDAHLHGVPWSHDVIGTNGDTYFTMATLSTPDGSFPCIVTAGYFSNKLNIYWLSDGSNVWTDKSKIRSRTIESGHTHIFDVQAADLNNDGQQDFVVSTNAVRGGGVYVYEVPQDFRTGTFTKHTIMTGFISHNILPGGGAPGSPKVVPVNAGGQARRPYIVLSGDDDGRAYLLYPSTQDPSDWTYQHDVILDMHSGTIGEIAIEDVDHDGNVEIFVPAYSDGTVYVYSLTV